MSPDVDIYTSIIHTDRFFFALPCDSFLSANIIPGPTAHAHDDPILVLQAEFRVESVRERERQKRFEAVDCIFTAKGTSSSSKPGAAFQQDMVRRNMDDVGTPPRPLVTFFSLCAACMWTDVSLKGRASLGASFSFYSLHTPTLVWYSGTASRLFWKRHKENDCFR